MSLAQYSKEELQDLALIEIAFEYLNNSKQPVGFNELVNEIATALGLSEQEMRSRLAQFYTDINIDGRFLSLGENRWGLRTWYPVDTAEEDVITPVKPKKKKAKKVVDEDLDDFDEIEEDYDELDDFDEEDDVLDDELDDIDDEIDDIDDEFEEDDEVLEDDEEFDLDEDEELEEDLETELEEDEDLEIDDEEEDL
ncbi:DNA-directed RNA polymerase subunit delta [Neobacillus dielmonensis]|uniref:DNA-directed RNA polymerase subunit delta n=1 Tax=Neobacillus dielmonensis TaxID=1347369 RepID=UPI0005A62FC2|nr:DNA-directed RNA polymerase subunit delta [Neobacillus dielmonensis]